LDGTTADITQADNSTRHGTSASGDGNFSRGGDSPALVEAVKASNDRRAALSQRLEKVDRQQHSQTDYDELDQELKDHFRHSWETMLSRQIEQTRQILRKLFDGDRLPFLPKTFERGGQVEFTGTASIGRLVTGRAKAVVSHLTANWNHLSTWLFEMDLLQKSLSVRGLGAKNDQFQADSTLSA
jgi:hypothetical protein